jgi:hypothetical protein
MWRIRDLLAALLTLAGAFVFLLGLQAVAYAVALLAVILGISSVRVVRIGRG